MGCHDQIHRDVQSLTLTPKKENPHTSKVYACGKLMKHRYNRGKVFITNSFYGLVKTC